MHTSSDFQFDFSAAHSSSAPLAARSPLSWVSAAAALLCLLGAAPSWAQSTPDPVKGQLLFTDTPNQGVPPTVVGRCTNCHGSVLNRRNAIGGSFFAEIPFDTAFTRVTQAISTKPAMAQFKGLTTEQVQHLAAYIADTPKVTSPALSDTKTLAFVAPGVGQAVSQNVTIKHSLATTDSLLVTGIDFGTEPTSFTRASDCITTLAPATECTFAVTYTPTTATEESRSLTVTLQQGVSTFTRVVTLNGSVSVPPPPPAPVCFYEHVNYQGASFCAEADSGWIGAAWNDRVSSVKVPAGRQIQLFEHSNFGGRSLTLTSDTVNLVPLKFNDLASSFRIQAATVPPGTPTTAGGHGKRLPK